MAVRHRCLAVSRPLGVGVGLSAALRGPSKPAGGLQGTPEIRKCPSNALSQRRRLPAVRRSGPLRRPHGPAWTAIEATRVQSSGCCSESAAAAGRRTTGQGRGSGGSMRTIAPHDLGISARSTVVRHRRLAVSGPLGVRVGRSAALRGPSKPAGAPQGTPGNQTSARQRGSQRHTRTAGPRDSPTPAPNLEVPALMLQRPEIRP